VHHHRYVTYSAELVVLNKHQIYGGAPKVNWYPRAFSVANPSLWNSLPNSLRDPDLGKDGFSRLLKTHLFTLYRSI